MSNLFVLDRMTAAVNRAFGDVPAVDSRGLPAGHAWNYPEDDDNSVVCRDCRQVIEVEIWRDCHNEQQFTPSQVDWDVLRRCH